MADETGLAAVRERAETFLADNVDEFDGADTGIICARFAQSEREAEMERCCKDVCLYCNDAVRWSPAEKDEFNEWIHRSLGPVNAETNCPAAAIRERWDGKREG